MNTEKENEKPSDRTVRTTAAGRELSEAEPPAPVEPADLRETAEGYGWGV